MLPLGFDDRVLGSLPLPGDTGVKRVLDVLNALVARRVMAYFRSRRRADATRLVRVSERYAIVRLEDFHEKVRTVSLLSHSLDGWTVHIHERIFDYLALVLPKDPDSSFGASGKEGREALAFAELLLRHELEHMVYPEREEREVVASDVEFAMHRRETDPTYYETLCAALSNEMNGLLGEHYLQLFTLAERQEPSDAPTAEIMAEHVVRLAGIPLALLRGPFFTLTRDLKVELIANCFTHSRDAGLPLVERTAHLRKVLSLLLLQLERDRSEAQDIFKELDGRVGLVELLHELGDHPQELQERSTEELLELLAARLRDLAVQDSALTTGLRDTPPEVQPRQPGQEAPRTLKDRIEMARANPLVPASVIEAIERNRSSMHGHSGAKYSEFIETLLAVPWGTIHKIMVTPEEFEHGLDESHYGLQRPKEIIADFFANLIWRYRRFSSQAVSEWQRSGSAFLLVGPPGVGKTSLAISIARNLGIPYHKVSLGGMRDETDLVGHGFTYEGSKPGAIVQGLIKMGVMNGMIIMDEADKTERFAIATLLEILDPEQNHLFHDKYTQTTVDIDLSNCHFMLTANTLETVPPPVVNRCQVVMLSRYSIDEKIAIARRFVLPRIMEQHGLDREHIHFEPGREDEHLRFLVQHYTHEAGVRQLEHLLRTLLLRVQRKEMLGEGQRSVVLTRRHIKQYIEEPARPRMINDNDRIGEVLGLGVNVELGIGTVIPIQATRIHGWAAEGGTHGQLSMVHATGNIEKVMDESRTVATTGILHCAEQLGISSSSEVGPIHLHFMGASTRKDGPSAGGSIALALASLLAGRRLRRDVAMTGEIDTHGRITGIGGLDVKLETAISAGCRTVIVPRENLQGADGIEQFPEALKRELQILTYEQWQGKHPPFDYQRHVLEVVAVDHITQAHEVAVINQQELDDLGERVADSAHRAAAKLGGGRGPLRTSSLVLLVKDSDELDLEQPWPALGRDGAGCWLLVRPDARASIEAGLSTIRAQVQLRPFDPASEDVVETVQEIISTGRSWSKSDVLTLIAPYFTLDRAAAGRLPRSAPEVLLFANNYSAHGVKLKRCKPLLNRAFHRLSLLGPEALTHCPFVAKRDGIFVADLSSIPEKYRLDLVRAETILDSWLERWLKIMETEL